jgi:hypothetical protein
MSIILAEYAEDLILTQLNTTVTAGDFVGVLTATKMFLYTNNVAANSQTPLAAFTQTTVFAAPYQDLVFADPARNSDGGFAINSALINWVLASPYAGTSFYGYGVATVSGSPVLLWSEPFPFGQYNFVDQFSQLQISAQFAIGAVNFGAATYVY